MKFPCIAVLLFTRLTSLAHIFNICLINNQIEYLYGYITTPSQHCRSIIRDRIQIQYVLEFQCVLSVKTLE